MARQKIEEVVAERTKELAESNHKKHKFSSGYVHIDLDSMPGKEGIEVQNVRHSVT